MMHLLANDGKCLLCYLVDIFEKLNMLIEQLKGRN